MDQGPEAADLIASLHRRTLRHLNLSAGKQHQGCAQAAKALSINGRIGKRIRELDSVRGWTGKISEVKCDKFLNEVFAASAAATKKSSHAKATPKSFAFVDTPAVEAQ